nr:HNH endonuclease signature motif containing protein [uncultured Flavobacterium sp.]
MQKKNIRTRIPQREKIKAELQKEISSSCPFCMNSDVGHFEIHHIDEDRTNNEFNNLILVCPTCHSKITKGDITQSLVCETKNSFANKSLVQHIYTAIDQQKCGWKPIAGVENAFEAKILKSLFPVFNFSFISSSDQTLLLTHLSVRVKKLPIGLAGTYIPLPSILRPTITYKIKIPENQEEHTIYLEDELNIPPKRAF